MTKDIRDISEVELRKLHSEFLGPSVTHRQDRSVPTGWFSDARYVSDPPESQREVLKKLVR
jgi:hypothetical protein